ncbi:MAG: PQQ-binding-like beta-propeller repeat protein [Acidobacteria bacterium]|nr:PQQ-binding-like beta-propeller repeat protein [Acidobacteriota bacterium]
MAIFVLAAALPAADWLTFSGDPQRTGWAKEETAITKENVRRLKLLWKVHLENEPNELNFLTVPLVLERAVTPRGFVDIVVVAGSRDVVFAVDADTGKLLWRKQLVTEGVPKMRPSFLCPNALNATPVIEKRMWNWTVYAIASDGKLHSLNAVNGEDRKPPVQFVPPFSKNWSLNLADGLLYTALSQGCNGAKSGVYVMDLTDPRRPVTSFQASTAGAGIWGRAGVAVGSDGHVYAETGDGPWDPAAGKFSDTVLGLSSKHLKLADYYTPANRAWITKKDLDMGCMSPVVFPFREWELVAAAGKEGVIYLLDARSLGGPDHRSPLFRSPLYTNEEVNLAGRGFWGTLSTWEDPKGTRWLYAPAWGPQASRSPEFPSHHGPTPNGSVMAFRLDVKDGKPVLAPAWRSRDMQYAEPLIVANGIVFALSNGENVTSIHESGRLLTSLERASTPTGNAVLFAFDAETGEQLYSSGKTVPGWTHFSGLALSSGQIYAVTFDGYLYAFGLPESAPGAQSRGSAP